MSRFTEEVKAGIKLLDEHGPTGWRDMLQPEKLNMVSCYNCVLGQIYGLFSRGLIGLGHGVEWGFRSSKYGFCTPDADEDAMADIELRDEWITQLNLKPQTQESA